MADDYELRISIVNERTGEQRAHCLMTVPEKDFDLTHTGFATRYFHLAAADLLTQFHEAEPEDG